MTAAGSTKDNVTRIMEKYGMGIYCFLQEAFQIKGNIKGIKFEIKTNCCKDNSFNRNKRGKKSELGPGEKIHCTVGTHLFTYDFQF